MTRSKLIKPILCSLSALAWLGIASPTWADNEMPVAITNVTIVNGSQTIEGGTILMSKGRIVAAGTDVTIPAHAETIDGTGLVAYPGFIDAYSNLGIPTTQRTAEEIKRTEDEDAGADQGPYTATRAANRRGIHPQTNALDQFAPEGTQIADHRKLGFAAALVAPRAGIFGGTSVVINLSGEPIRRSVLTSGVAMHASFSTGEPGSYPGSPPGIIAQFRQALMDTQWYKDTKAFAARNPGKGNVVVQDAALEALEPVLAGTQRVFFSANSLNDIDRALNLAKQFNLDMVIVGGLEAHKQIDRLKAQGVTVIAGVGFPSEPGQAGGGRGGRGRGRGPAAGAGRGQQQRQNLPQRVRDEQRRLWEEQVSNIVKLHEAGIPFVISATGLRTPTDLHKQIRMLTERGLPEEVAVAAMTSGPATLLGVDDQIGSISVGKRANLTILTGRFNSEDAKVKMVFSDGNKFEIEEGDAEGDDNDQSSRRGRRGGRRGRGAAGRTGSESSDKDEEKDEEKDEKEEEEVATWESEILADRVPATKTDGDVLIQNATIITVAEAGTLQNASILIRNGKIEAIGNNISAPTGVTVIDGTGRYVIPGLIDAHSHLGASGINEGSLSITAEVVIGDVLDPTNAGLYRALAGGITSQHVMHGSANPIGGQNETVKLKYNRPASEFAIQGAARTIKFALGENVKRAGSRSGGRGGATRPLRYPATRMGVESTIRRAFQEAKNYDARRQDFRRRTSAGEDLAPLRNDLRLQALVDILNGDLLVHCHSYRSDEILSLIHTAEDFGFRIGTFQHVLEGYRLAPEIARHGAGASTFAEMWAYKMEAYGAIPHNAALMTNHGVVSSINSDSADKIRYMAQQAALSVRYGDLSEIETLKLVTLNPAIQLGIDHLVGSLEVGKDGDVAIFNGHPLNTFSKNIMTIIDGEVFFEDKRPDPVADTSALTLAFNPDMTIPSATHNVYAIVGGTVHTISGPVIEDGTVVVMDDKIHAVGKRGDVIIPPGAGVIQATGKHVYPGLIDASTTLGLVEIGSVAVTSDTTEIGTFNPELKASKAVNAFSELHHTTRTGGTTTVLTRPSGGRISGRAAVMNLDGWSIDEMLVDDDAALIMALPSSRGGGGRGRGRGRGGAGGQTGDRQAQVRKQVAELEDYIASAKHYAKVKELARTDSSIDFEVDVKMEAMIPYVTGEKPVIFNASDPDQIMEIIEFAEKNGLKPVISGATLAWKIADKIAEKNVPLIFSNPLSSPRGQWETWDSVYRAAGVLDKAGVKFCFATNGASSAFMYGTQVGMAVAHGLSPEKAVYAMTLGAAEILGMDDRLGSIDVGKQADLIITTHHPAQTVNRVTHMFIKGKPVELTSMQSRSYEKFKNRPTPKLPPERTDLKGQRSLTRPTTTTSTSSSSAGG